MTRIIPAFVCCIVVAACAIEQTSTEHKVVWARTDGRHCRDEVQKENPSDNNNKMGALHGQSKGDDKIAGCMVERGYLAAK